jgi:hypothetical protein
LARVINHSLRPVKSEEGAIFSTRMFRFLKQVFKRSSAAGKLLQKLNGEYGLPLAIEGEAEKVL